MIIVALEILKKGDEVKHKIGDPLSLAEANKTQNVPASENTSNTVPKRVLQENANTSNYNERSQSLNESMMPFDARATHPISGLSPYQNKWVIKARVTAKSPIREWSNAKGEGKLFSMDLMDDSGQIRVTGFRDSVDKFYEMIEVIYYTKLIDKIDREICS